MWANARVMFHIFGYVVAGYKIFKELPLQTMYVRLRKEKVVQLKPKQSHEKDCLCAKKHIFKSKNILQTCSSHLQFLVALSKKLHYMNIMKLTQTIEHTIKTIRIPHVSKIALDLL